MGPPPCPSWRHFLSSHPKDSCLISMAFHRWSRVASKCHWPAPSQHSWVFSTYFVSSSLPPFPLIFLLLLLYPSHPLPGSAPGAFGFPNPTSADSVPLYFSCITSPCFGLFYVSFLCLSFARSFCACINNWTQISGPMSLPCKRPVTFTWFPANCDAFRLKKSAKINCLNHRWTWQRQ